MLVVSVLVDVVWLVARPHLTGTWSWVPLLGAIACHLVLLERERRRPALRRGSVIRASAMVLVVAVAVAPSGSRDLYSYAFYGHMIVAHHANPYLVRPDAFATDPLLRSVARPWRDVRTVYGPVFTLLSVAGATGYGTSATLARIYFQGLEALAVLGGLVLLARRRVSTYALIFVGLSPAMLAVVNGGHNDALTGVLLLAGILLVIDRRVLPAGLVLGAAAMVKLIILPAVALVIVALIVNGQRRDAWRASLTIAASIATGYLLVGGPAALAPLRASAQSISRASVWHAMADIISPLSGRAELSGHTAKTLGLLVVAALTIALVARLRRPVDLPLAAVSALLLFLLASQYVLPWYSAMVLPAAGLLSGRVQRVAYLQATLLLLVYVVAPGATTAHLPALGSLVRVAPVIELALIVSLLWRRAPPAPAPGTTPATIYDTLS